MSKGERTIFTMILFAAIAGFFDAPATALVFISAAIVIVLIMIFMPTKEPSHD